MLNVYCYKNVKVPFYDAPFFTAEPKDAVVKGISRSCILNRDDMIKYHRNECELYFLGEYDDEKGVFHLLEDKEFLLDLAPLCKE